LARCNGWLRDRRSVKGCLTRDGIVAELAAVNGVTLHCGSVGTWLQRPGLSHLGHALRPLPSVTGTSRTLVAGLARDGPIAPSVLDGAMDRDGFGACVTNQRAPALRPGQIVVAAKPSSHRSIHAPGLLRAKGNALIFLPQASGPTAAGSSAKGAGRRPCRFCNPRFGRGCRRAGRWDRRRSAWPFRSGCRRWLRPCRLSRNRRRDISSAPGRRRACCVLRRSAALSSIPRMPWSR